MVPSEVINNLGRVSSSMRRGIVKFRAFLKKEKNQIKVFRLVLCEVVLMPPIWTLFLQRL